MKPPLLHGNSDDFQTPACAINPSLKYIPNSWIIWECACGKGNLVKAFNELGYKCVGSDILDGKSFYLYEPDNYDIIVTNPPFSQKQMFLERAYQLGKPFAFLLPLTTFETRKRQSLFEKYGVEVLLLDRRINFITPSGRGSGSWFATAWFTNWLNIGKELNYEHYAETC